MKRFLFLLTVICLAISSSACSGNAGQTAGGTPGYSVAMITDAGDITDRSFNQSTYEACKAFCTEYDIKFTYKKPNGDNASERISAIESAIDEGYNVIVMPGYVYGGVIARISKKYKDVKFLALDVSAGDILETAVPINGGVYDYTPSNWNVSDYYYTENVYCAIYQEELCGYMAGYAAVKLGYRDLGFLGGMAVPGVMRFGYGFVQGADAAASETNEKITLKYAYANTFESDAEITAAMDTWYASGTDIVFSCGGGLFVSVAEAAAKADGKIIGVDVDQKDIIDGMFGEGLTVTSAMKGLYTSAYDALKEIIIDGKWEDYSGKISSLGLVSGTEPEKNYVQIPMESTQWGPYFTKEDYKALVLDMFDGNIKVSGDISKEPETGNISVEWLGSIK